MKQGITVHAMVRNEPFVFYSIMSVYPYVDKILLWDTGSDDHTLEDIQDLLKLDKDNKIDFRQVEIETDERYWSVKTSALLRESNEGKRGKGVVRKEMIDETDTDFFMILDGDEVWYRDGMLQVLEWIEQARHNDTLICARVPLRWFKSPTRWFWLTSSTRIFKTERVIMHTASPGEMHMDKNNPVVNSLNAGNDCVATLDCTPYAHYETMLKPWRRVVDPSQLERWSKDNHPQVIYSYPQYLKRFRDEGPACPPESALIITTKVEAEPKPKDSLIVNPYADWHPKLQEIWTERCVARCVVNRHKKLCFVFVAKNASSTIKRMMGEWEMLRYTDPIHREIIDSCTKFTVVREPYTRFVSAFTEVTKFRKDSLWAREIALSQPFAKIGDIMLRFKRFVQDIRNTGIWDLHLVPQVAHIDGSKVEIDKWITFERISQQLPKLFADAGYPAPIEQANTSRDRIQAQKLNTLLLHHKPSRDVIDYIYADDFKLYREYAK